MWEKVFLGLLLVGFKAAWKIASEREEASAVVVVWDTTGTRKRRRTEEVMGRMGDGGNKGCAGQMHHLAARPNKTLALADER